jgi:hypothetical protein
MLSHGIETGVLLYTVLLMISMDPHQLGTEDDILEPYNKCRSSLIVYSIGL